jgi:uncharacterized membrane protein
MDPVMLVLRTFHVIGGVLWVGSAFLFVAFIGPTAVELGPKAGPFMSGLIKQRKGARFITGVALTTVIAGWLMWLVDLSRYGGVTEWVGSTFGLVITIGGIIATIAAYFGITGVGNNVEKLVDLGDEVAASGGPPTPEQGARMGHLSAEIKKHGMIDIVLVLLAVTLMATARYW